MSSQGRKSAPTADRQIIRQLDQLEGQLIEGMNRRAELLGQLPAERRLQRTRRADGWCSGRNPGPLPSEGLERVFRELDSATRQLHAPRKIAYLGPPFSYSHLAAIERFGLSADLVPVPSIAAVFAEVQRQQVDEGIVPIENSTDGRIVDTLEMFVQQPVQICGEVRLRIHHSLLGRGPREAIREVYSKPQALSQCRQWLSTHLPEARIIATASTTAAAQEAARSPSAAAVASRAAAQQYDLEVLAEGIEDNPDNVTRFAVLGHQPAERTGQRDRTALVFELSHQPGALADAMAVFKRHRLNLTWIESFPKRGGTKQEYWFFVELEGHSADLRVRRALSALEKKAHQMRVLGTYPRADIVE
jgi:chorismate mutase/prephenate dehydratase